MLCAYLLAQTRLPEPVEPPRTFPTVRASTWMDGAAPFDIRSVRGKVVLVHFTPTFCCGYDYAAKMVHQALVRFGDKGLTAFGVFSGTLDSEQAKIWTEVKPEVPVTWPVLVDQDGATAKALFPGEGEVRYSFSFIDRKGKYRKFKFQKLDEVFPVAESLLAERG